MEPRTYVYCFKKIFGKIYLSEKKFKKWINEGLILLIKMLEVVRKNFDSILRKKKLRLFKLDWMKKYKMPINIFNKYICINN